MMKQCCNITTTNHQSVQKALHQAAAAAFAVEDVPFSFGPAQLDDSLHVPVDEMPSACLSVLHNKSLRVADLHQLHTIIQNYM